MRSTFLFLFSFCCVIGCSQKPLVVLKPGSIEQDKLYKHFDAPFVEHSIQAPLKKRETKTFTLQNGLFCNLTPASDAGYVHINFVIRHNQFRNKYFDRLIGELLKITAIRNNLLQNLPEEFIYETYSDFSTLSISSLEADTELALQTLLNQFTDITWTRDDFEHAKLLTSFERKVNQNINSQLLYKSFKALTLGPKHHYNDHDNTEKSKVSLEKIKAYFREQYVPENAALIVTGKFDIGAISEKIEQDFSTWLRDQNKQKNKAVRPEPSDDQASPKNDEIYLIHKAKAQQVNIITGFRSVARSHPDWFQLHFASILLGGGSHSRLFTDIREQRGLSYSIWARQTELRDTGLFYIRTSTANEKVAAILTGINQHRELLPNKLVNKEELAIHQNFLLGQQVFRNESLEMLAEQIAKDHVLSVGTHARENYFNQIRQIESKDLQQQASRYFTRPWTTVLIGDAEHVLPQLRQYFPGTPVKLIEPDALF